MASNGKWNNPVPTQADRGTSLAFQSLSSYLGGWVPWDGTADISWSSGVYTKGNAVVTAEYKLQGDICFYQGTYVVGSTTSFPGAGALMRLNTPFAVATGLAGSAYFGGKVYDLSGGASGTPVCFELTAPRASTLYVTTTKATHDLVTAANPFAWTTLDMLAWEFWFRVLV